MYNLYSVSQTIGRAPAVYHEMSGVRMMIVGPAETLLQLEGVDEGEFLSISLPRVLDKLCRYDVERPPALGYVAVE